MLLVDDINDLQLQIKEWSESDNRGKKYLLSRVGAVGSLPLELLVLTLTPVQLLGSILGNVIKGGIKVIRLAASNSEFLKKCDAALPGPIDFWNAIKKTACIAAGFFASLFVGIFHPITNFKIHEKLGLVEIPKSDKNEPNKEPEKKQEQGHPPGPPNKDHLSPPPNQPKKPIPPKEIIKPILPNESNNPAPPNQPDQANHNENISLQREADLEGSQVTFPPNEPLPLDKCLSIEDELDQNVPPPVPLRVNTPTAQVALENHPLEQIDFSYPPGLGSIEEIHVSKVKKHKRRHHKHKKKGKEIPLMGNEADHGEKHHYKKRILKRHSSENLLYQSSKDQIEKIDKDCEKIEPSSSHLQVIEDLDMIDETDKELSLAHKTKRLSRSISKKILKHIVGGDESDDEKSVGDKKSHSVKFFG